jgi:hypothetical protein
MRARLHSVRVIVAATPRLVPGPLDAAELESDLLYRPSSYAA